jgi:hypothetical protein
LLVISNNNNDRHLTDSIADKSNGNEDNMIPKNSIRQEQDGAANVESPVQEDVGASTSRFFPFDL